MQSWGRVGAAAVVGAALVSACASTKSTGSSDTTTTKPARVARPAPFTPAELEARIVTKAPAGFVVQPPENYDTGPSDLAKAVRDDGSPDAEKVLRAEKFVRGYQRIWIGPDNTQIIVFVSQFESRDGARKDYARYTRGIATKTPPGAHKFVLADLPKGRSLGIAGADKTGGATLIFFTTGVFNVEINTNGPALSGLQARATAIAEDQFRRL